MSSIGYRRKGDNTPLYNPERDYAYITPTLMRIAIETLDAKDPPERAAWRIDHGVKQVDIVQLAEALAKAQNDFVNAADPVKSFEEALNRHGFFNFNYEIRQYLFSAIGEVFCAAWFKAVREVSTVNEESPAAADMARFTAAVRDFVSKAGLPVYDTNYVAEYQRVKAQVMESRLKSALETAQKYKTDYYRLLEAHETLTREKQTPGKAQTFFARFFGKRSDA